MSPGFHIGLCPHFTLGYAGVPPLQGSLSYWAFGVLCRGIVFVKCVWVCKWIVAFVFLYLIVIVLFVVLRGGIDCCGRATSPKGAILLQSPGREPWVNHCNTFIEPLQGPHFLTQGCVWSLCCIYSVGHLLAWVSAAPAELI